MAKYHSITLEQANEKVSYDPETGVFTLRNSGKPYLAKDGVGYRIIAFGRVKVLQHRLAFLFMTGQWPKQNVDHINGDRLDNRWANLRDVPQRVNCQNKAGVRNGSKVLGANFNANAWEARINIGGKALYLGRFKTQQEAHDAYARKADELSGIPQELRIQPSFPSKLVRPRQAPTAIAANPDYSSLNGETSTLAGT